MIESILEIKLNIIIYIHVNTANGNTYIQHLAIHFGIY